MTRDLSEIGVPIYLSIVFKPTFNGTVLNAQGYEAIYYFFVGNIHTMGEGVTEKMKNGLHFGGYNSSVTGCRDVC